MTRTSSFGTSKREGHDSSDFYNRNLYNGFHKPTKADLNGCFITFFFYVLMLVLFPIVA